MQRTSKCRALIGVSRRVFSRRASNERHRIPSLVDGIAASLQAGRHSAVVGRSILVIRILSVRLLLTGLLSPFIDAAESARKATHRSTGCSALTGIARYCATDRAEGRTASDSFENMRLRRLVGFGLA